MFLKTGEMKKIMKSSLKKHGLTVGNVDGHYLVYSDNWGVYVEHAFATNKFKAAIMELVGDLPEPYECCHYTVGGDKEIRQQGIVDYPDPYGMWKAAKDFGVPAPMYLAAWPHEYAVYQRRSDLKFIVALRGLTAAAISSSELDTACEHMPERPSILNGSVLYYKNESTIYWVHTGSPGHRTLEVLFPHMEGISFFEDGWLEKAGPVMPDGPESITETGATEAPLPY